MLNCIIIDDKVDSNILGSLVAKCPSLNLVGTYNDSGSALNQLSNQHNIDLAIIDIKMAGVDGFEMIKNLKNPPDFIAVCSDGQYAMKAFDYNFVDYLLKPVSYSRFCRAVDKTIRYNSQKEISNPRDMEIFIKKDSSLIKLNIKDITYIEALENYIILNTNDKKYTLHYTMKSIEYQLPPDIFKRVHRSFIVNKKLIKTINEGFVQIILGDNLKELPIGKSFRNTMLNELFVVSR